MELTEHQKKCWKALETHGSITATAKALNMERSNLKKTLAVVRRKMAEQGWSPEHDMVHSVPDGFKVKGVSTLYTNGEDGTKVAAQWVKSCADRQRQEELAQQMVQAWCEAAKGIIKPIKGPKVCNSSLLTIYPLGDPHFGMYAWGDETGKDFDLDIAEKQLMAAIDYLVEQSPASERGVLCNLGDMFHSDNMDGVTARSGHSLDMDGRLQKVIDVGVRALRRCIHRMLEKHKIVEIVNAPGNHDHVLALALNVMFKNIYENEPRVRVYSAPTMRHYIEHGKVLIGVVHGHQTRDNALGEIMATEKPEQWGKTQHRYFYRGHHHQDKVTELRGCKVEQFRTLAPKDAYAAGGGYLSGQDMKAIVHHAEHGEIARSTFAISMMG